MALGVTAGWAGFRASEAETGRTADVHIPTEHKRNVLPIGISWVHDLRTVNARDRAISIN